PLAEHLGSVVLVVNTASRCGLTPQYAGLQALHERYSDRGLRPATSSCTRSPAPRRRSPSSARSTTASPSRCTRRSRSTGKAPIPCSGGSPAPTARGSPAGTSNGTSRSSCSGPTARCGAGTRRRRSRPIWPTTSRRSWPSGADSSAAEHPPVCDDLPAVVRAVRVEQLLPLLEQAQPPHPGPEAAGGAVGAQAQADLHLAGQRGGHGRERERAVPHGALPL